MQLAMINLTTGDTRRYEIDYSLFLVGAGARGYLKTASVTISTPPSITSSVVSSSISPDGQRLYFFIKGGTLLNEQFTVAVQVTDTQGETVNDTLLFTVVAA